MRRKELIILSGVTVVVLGLAGYLIREKFMDGGQNLGSNQKYEKAMEDDNYGGKTGEETLVLFIAALKAGDAELASKYFMLDSDLSRDKWVRTLALFKDRGLLDKIAQDIEKNPGLVELRLNEYSGVWKIVSFL